MIESAAYAAVALGTGEVIIGLLGAGGLGALLAFRKTNAETEAITTATLRGVIEELRVEVKRLSEENGNLRERIAILERSHGSA